MRSKLFIIACLLVLNVWGQQKKALFIIVDGISADLIEKLNTPALDAIAGKGGYTRAIVGGEKGGYSQTPTISAVGYNTVLTGTWVNKHNVWDNDIAAPNYHYPTIFRLFKEQYPERKVAIFSSWLDNRTKLVGDNLPATRSILIDHHFDGLEHDTITYPHDPETAYMARIDAAVVDHAANYIRNHAPDLSWIYLEYTDDMGHHFGDGPRYYAAIEKMDSQIAQIWEAVNYRQNTHQEEWQIIVTTDHGRDSATGRNHGGQSERERRGWIVTNAKGLNDYFKTGAASIADIMPTIARFLDVKISRDRLWEVDGIPLTGKVSLSNANAFIRGNELQITWKAHTKRGWANIRVATTNQYKEGGKDEYRKMKRVRIRKGKASIDISGLPSAFYKIVIGTPENHAGRWVIPTTVLPAENP